MVKFEDVEVQFHSMPQTKFDIPEWLEREWLLTAVTDYELNVGIDLGLDVTHDTCCNRSRS